jgi:DNA-binding HxlR family transcriptional regulator
MPVMPAPRPGKPVRGSKTGRPIMALLDLLGRRWQLRVIWELSKQPLTFRDLRAACGDISPTILNTRLAELRDAGIVTLGGDGYALSAEGRALLAEFMGLHEWAERWAKRSAR